MSPTQVPPKIFDQSLLAQSRMRAARRNISFLMERAAQDATDRICDINRTFNSALILGSPPFFQAVTRNLPSDKRPDTVTHGNIIETDNHIEIQISGNDISVKPGYDLIISGLTLHALSNLPTALFECRKLLEPDGLFIGGMFGGQTLTELRQAFYAADDHHFGGMSAHIYPFADYSQTASLLQRVGYALPVIDSDRFTVNYKKFQTLIDDLRDLGDTNCLYTRHKNYLGKAYVHTLETAYKDNFSMDDKLKATFEILWLTGWAPHESQQQPLKPGSAKMRLADALGTKEQKL